ncbi:MULTISPECIES: hypothetical protein [Cyanophyceae]|uniref:hypothetical protein n=1 Tax=Cyanophyceae TaxID=3028117 RepID=UPI0004AB30A9|nr:MULTISPECIES: hypothetical protein [Cyanophyceae]ANV88408.1 hypothetical protein AWQ22_13575 [Picosynechococcus sp. PCC 7117]ANV91592.1 hypothetical protein AWQ24_13665 [Picosynechococcus sp. PCC 8807]QCS48513.1 hypothetical protein FEK30_03125 [Picosynechococcus sp. PCC 11901]SMH51261.1 hypothetical protein SAMN06272755_2313 [Picosynechococcus sp. OG1]SMQ82014.1 hypothetical protein SAMN06272774_1589 [Synechococcus sp. 7002]
MTKVTPIASYLRQTNSAEQELYDYLMHAVQSHTPDELLQEFKQFLLEGRQAPTPELHQALITILKTPGVEEDFKFILNRCCHIIINRWQIHPQLQKSIPRLVELFDSIPPPSLSTPRLTKLHRQLVADFSTSEQYLTLQRLARVVEDDDSKKKFTWNDQSVSVGQLIQRYPYLYEHCLLSEDSSFEHQQTVRQVQARIQRAFELDLSKYVMYQVRLAQLARRKHSIQDAKQMLQGVQNPTLLTERELGTALKYFVGKPERGHSYRDLSQYFLRRTTEILSYEDFKHELFSYLISSVDQKYGKLQFNQRLYQKLQTMLPNYDHQKPNELLMMRTASQLLNYLIVESPQRPEHYVFVDMITNLGPTVTVALLLKLVLMCGKAKPHLERRFSILFSHYESQSQEGVPWLIKSLENLHIALSVHFGDADVSFLKQIM